MSVLSCGISSRASDQTEGLSLASADGVRISRYLRPFKSGDFQLMSQLRSSRQESLGVVPAKRVSGTDTFLGRYFSLDSERYLRVGAGDTSPPIVLRRCKIFALMARWHMWETRAWGSFWNALNRAPLQ